MNTQNAKVKLKSKLPDLLLPFFWDYDFDSLTLEDDHELIIGRVVTSGDWKALTWLRSHAGDQSVREWIERHKGRGLTPQRLRFWELILGLPRRQVDTWLAPERRKIWGKKANP